MEQVKKTTAMQQLTEWLDELGKIPAKGVDSVFIFKIIHEKATELLEVAKQQIIEAFNQGFREGEDKGEDFNPEKDVSECYDAEYYYNNKYK